MINNYNDPRVTLNQVYKAAVEGTSAVLGACVIGPHYNVHTYSKEGLKLALLSDSLVYNPTTAVSDRAYPVKPLGAVDTATVEIFVKDAHLQYQEYIDSAANTPYTISLGTSKDQLSVMHTSDSTYLVFTGEGYTTAFPVEVGDYVQIAYGESSESLTTVDAFILKFVSTTVGTSTRYTGCILSLKITLGQDDKIFKVNFSRVMDAYVGNTVGGTTSAVDAKTATIGMKAQPASKPVRLDPSLVTEGEYPILNGQFFVEYRDFATEFIGKYGYVAGKDAVLEVLGDITASNPLGIAVHEAALAAGNNFVYFVAVNVPETASSMLQVDAYIKAADVVANVDGIHGIVPCTTDAGVLRAMLSYALTQSSEDIPYFKYIYGSADFPELLMLTEQSLAVVASTTEVGANTAVNFKKSILALIDHSVTGCYLRKNNGAELYLIVALNDTDQVTIEGAHSLAVDSAWCIVDKTGAKDNYKAIAYVVLHKPFGDKRGCFVIADGPMHNGLLVPNYVTAAGIAGLRSNSYPHAPLSNVTVPGITVTGARNLTYSQSKFLGANGFWRVALNTEGNVITLRQLTSAAKGDVNYDEQSIVCTIDYVCLVLKFAGRAYVGNTNISNDLIDLLEADLDIRITAFLEPVSTLLGPMLLNCTIDQLLQDPVDRSKVRAVITGQPPAPFNEFNITFYMS